MITGARVDRRRFLNLTLGAAAVGTAVTASGPLTQASAAPGTDYTTRETFDATFEAFVDSGVDGQHYHDNESGGLAWGQSYVLLGLMRMYQTYADPQYLDTFVTHADAVLDNRDEQRGVTDYRRRSGPVWRAGDDYTASHADVPGSDGASVLQIRNADSQSSKSKLTVAAGSEPDIVTLTMTHVEHGTKTVEDVSTDPDHDRFVETVVVESAYSPWGRWTAKVVGSGVPEPGDYSFEQQYYAYAVHTGMIIYPMALFARVVLTDPKLARSRYRGAAQRYLVAVRRALDFHAVEYHELPGGRGSYIWPKGAPVPFDGTEQPYNQSHAPGLAFAELYRVLGRHDDRRTVEQLAATWRRDLVDEGGWASWHYWPTWGRVYQGYRADDDVSAYTPWHDAVESWEDISHAAISVEFAVAAHGAGIGIDDADLDRFVRSYLDGYLAGDASVRNKFHDTEEASIAQAVQAARWIGLDPQQDAIADHVLGIYARDDFEAATGSHVLGVGYLNYGAHDGWT